MTDTVLARLQALDAQRTPGPWEESTSPDYFADGAYVVREPRDLAAPLGTRDGKVLAVLPNVREVVANRAFIAAMGTHATALLRIAAAAQVLMAQYPEARFGWRNLESALRALTVSQEQKNP